MQVIISVQNPTTVTINGSFGIGGGYETSQLTGTNQITSNFSEIITTNKSYNFGVDGGTGTISSSGITITAVDTISGDIYNYTLNRIHGDVAC